MRARKVASTLKGATQLSLIPSKPSLRQLEFLALEVEEALYGGAAGGGKTEALLMGALQYIDVPGYAAGIFRRTKTEMLKPDAPLDRAHSWFATARLAGLARWHEESSTYFFKTRPGAPDSQLHFGHMAIDRDMGAYQSSAFQYVGADELTFIKENHYRFLFSRCRPSAQLLEPVICRVRGGTNPGGPGHKWVKERFVSRAVHILGGTEAIRDIAARRHGIMLPTPALYVSPPSADALELARELGRKPRRAYFVPAFAQDNPYLVGEALARYRENLLQLDPVRRKQLEWGDWEVESTGGFFTDASFELVEVLPDIVEWVRPWDLAATEAEPGTDPDWTASARMGLFLDGLKNDRKRFALKASTLTRFRKEPGPTQAEVVATCRNDPREVVQLFEQEPGSGGKITASNWHELLPGLRVETFTKSKSKDIWWRPMSGHTTHVGPIVIEVDSPAARANFDTIVAELKSIPVGHDDIADFMAQGFARLAFGAGDRGTTFAKKVEQPSPLRSKRI